ncbi:hypothetical protein ACELLULO517_15750 [Acidisoma cellulosilytica]|uniref:Uncharacterized protein n=1 Tax=Acidisoma cellulosilyticum TaxID=2802395 RepID=A0A964E4T1_9PROT|nr:hypothetical protein [Acidisoma cellulosilyticum]MCB8881702.1 hypothetical protein [Acidisoma cellulosilyticum]
MADISDVQDALVTQITKVVYPNGPSLPSALPGKQGVKIYPGWPNSAGLNNDIAAGILNCSVFALPSHSKLTTRYPRDWHPAGPAAPLALAVAQTKTQTTFTGTPAVNQIIGIRCAKAVYSYAVATTDTLETIATAIASLVPGASADGATVTVPAAPDFLVRLGQMRLIEREIRRQQQMVAVTLWCTSPDTRNKLGSLIDGALADVDWLPLPDGTYGWLKYASTANDDVPTKDALWKRTLQYLIEYPTMQTQVAPPLLFEIIDRTANNSTVSETVL